ncbi:MAG: hypothetical protein ABH861_04880 [Patescibacteria group bacterium]|nr:hypothetical protein [Patescibacteria group bacterium]MBU1034703.1 hypothetical protein [Patescibacteria group bacterium]
MADGKEFAQKPLPSNLAADFAADQARDMFEETAEQEEMPVSPLELPMRSYTQPTEEIEGVSSTMAKLEAEKQRELQMTKTAEQLVGAPIVPSAGPAAERPPEEEAARGRARAGRVGAPPQAGQPAAEAISEGAQVRELAEQRKAESTRIAAEVERRQRIVSAEQNEATEKNREKLRDLWRVINGLNTVTSISIFSFIAMLLMTNAQLINRLVFKNYDIIPKPNAVEMGLTAYNDISCCCTIMPIFSIGCLVVMALAYFIYKFITAFPLVGTIISSALK